MKQYNQHNFFKHTFCIFKEVQSGQLPFGDPDYISKNGSKYFFTNTGLFRISNHWGRVANCRWRLNTTQHQSQKTAIGFALWTDFFPNNETENLFFIEKTNNEYQYNHKAHAKDKNIIFRTAGDTAKILKQIKEIENRPAWFRYFELSEQKLREYLIHELIYSRKTLHQLKKELLTKTNSV